MNRKELFNKFCQRIDFVMKSASFRNYLMRRARELYGMPNEEGEDDIVGWTVNVNYIIPPDIEVYIDTMARVAAEGLKELDIYDEAGESYSIIMQDMFSEVVIHELLHQFVLLWDEDKVYNAVDAILSSPSENPAVIEAFNSLFKGTMVMKWISCPKTNGLVNWDTCFQCDDFTKHPMCPLQRIRKNATPREYTEGRYHVSELYKPRGAYYERWHPTVWDWDEYWAMLWGRGFGDFIESLYPEGQSQFEFDVPAADIAKFLGIEPSEYDNFSVLGHADVVSTDDGLVLELKTQWSLKYVVDAPNPIHRWQLLAYWTLGLIQFPETFSKIEELRLVYFGRTWRGRTMPPYKEHIVQKETVDLLTPGRIMRKHETTSSPPQLMCPEWMCKKCQHKALCARGEGRP